MKDLKTFVLRVLKIYKKFKKTVLITFLILLLCQILSLIIPYLFGEIINNIQEKSFEDVLFLTIISFLIALTVNRLSLIKDKIELRELDFDVREHISKETLKKILSFSIGQHLNENSGVKQSIISKGQHSLSTLAYMFIYNVVPTFLTIVLSVIALVIISPLLGGIVFLSIASFVIITVVVNKKVKKKLDRLEDLFHENSKIHTEILRNLVLVQGSSMEDKVSDEFQINLKGISRYGKKLWIKYSYLMHNLMLIPHFAKYVVILLGAYYVMDGVYSLGYMVIFWSWTSSAFSGLQRLRSIQRQLMNLYVAIEKYFIMIDVEPDIKDSESSISLEKIKGEIEFKDVSFKYSNRNYLKDDNENDQTKETSQKNTLKNVSFRIKAGQKVAFVGDSGVGKSTIMNIIMRAYDPCSGSVSIDGVDLKNLNLKNYRKSIGLVEQGIMLFDNTIRYNILFGLNGKAKDVKDSDLDLVAKLSCMDKFFHKLENGYDTLVGEKGVKLSGGEGQRLAIARALIKNPKILILDEATSSLDSKNEKIIQESIYNASKNRTTIIIAHRFSTIKNCDKIFVLKEGQIVGEGEHKDLIKNCSEYAELLENQISSF